MLCRLRPAVALGLSVCVIAAVGVAEPTAPEPTPSQTPPPATDPAAPQVKDTSPETKREPGPFDAQILEAARVFRSDFTRVSDTAAWVPEACTTIEFRPSIQQSTSRDSDTHGKKLYYLFAKDAADYASVATAAHGGDYSTLQSPYRPDERTMPWKAKIGQTLVKQSFVPERVPSVPEKAPTENGALAGIPSDHVVSESGDVYRPGAPAALFIMLKTDPATPGTDEGWVYSTTTPDGKSILSAGMIASCIGCHQHNTRDRLFGPKLTAKLHHGGTVFP